MTYVLNVIVVYSIAVGSIWDPRVATSVGAFTQEYHGKEACERARRLIVLDARNVNAEATAACAPKGD